VPHYDLLRAGGDQEEIGGTLLPAKAAHGRAWFLYTWTCKKDMFVAHRTAGCVENRSFLHVLCDCLLRLTPAAFPPVLRCTSGRALGEGSRSIRHQANPRSIGLRILLSLVALTGDDSSWPPAVPGEFSYK
jgi:hypothetical protein